MKTKKEKQLADALRDNLLKRKNKKEKQEKMQVDTEKNIVSSLLNKEKIQIKKG